MTKRTKNIILWAVGIWFAIGIVSAIIYGPSETQEVQTEVKVSDDAAFRRCKNLYYKLMSFKDSPDFHRYGFGEGGDFHGWYMAAHNFTQEDDRYLMRTYEFVSGDLLMLAQEYLDSKGAETEYSRDKREFFERIFSE